MSDNTDWKADLEAKCENASHPSVSRAVLNSTHGKYSQWLSTYLFPDEQPVAIFDSGATLITAPNTDSWEIDPGFRKTGHLILTDRRILTVTSTNSRDQLVSIDHEEIATIDGESKWRKDAITLRTVDGGTYRIELVNADFSNVVDLIHESMGSPGSAEPQATEFKQEIDDVVAEAEDAETVLQELSDLIVDSDHRTGFDRAVSDASSLDELVALISVDQEHSPSDASHPVLGGKKSQLPIQRSQISDFREKVAYTAKNADPAEVGKYTLGAGLALGTAAVSAPFSTALGLGAIAASGAATGAYASAHPDSLAARIDPIELSLNAKSRGRAWQSSSAPGGSGVGATLGAVEYLGDEAVPPAYSHWFTMADIEMIRKGAALGAQKGATSPGIGNSRQAAAIGGGLGLAYGYAKRGDQMDDLESLLDGDLYAELTDVDSGENTDDEIDV
ncbi:hypothetical protein [Haloterrigena alkaliphila]|uniref:hypothetical protein n=1 Tax=Haloterrigena alkaliphila TaxID=2816475 RepID=UPI001CFF6341|nr:hypothetical protein [Haloterrigena alkaliphila]UHQ95094.1 hypothetical protein J0X25_19765 [Haloterrigena alkaliphila]